VLDDYNETTYGDAWAGFYDDPILAWPEPASAVDFLAQRSRQHRALDLGAGTGRIAVPLAQQGFHITAVDASKAMLEKLTAKAAGLDIKSIQADFSEFTPPDRYDLVYCVGQSFLQLQSQEQQRAALTVMTEALSLDGTLIIEALTPDLKRFRVGQDFLVNKILPDSAVVTASLHEPLHQKVHSLTIRWDGNGARFLPNFIRYCWPSELLLMAEIAGLRLVSRYKSWTGAPYQGGPGAYVAEFRKAVSDR
jgi:SAM-dependent methyltransferase